MNSNETAIIEAAIRCIERYGMAQTTIRRIGAEAGMNSAAISYYFRSKDALMQRVMEVTLHNAFDETDFAFAQELPLEQRLFAIMDTLCEGALRYPGMARAHLHELFLTGRRDTPAVAAINLFLKNLADDILRRDPSLPPRQLRVALSQLAAGTFVYFATVPSLMEDFTGRALSDPQARQDYVRSLTHRLIGPLVKG